MFSDRDGGSAPQTIAAVEDYPSVRIVRLRGSLDQKTVTELEKFRKWVAKHSSFKHKHIILDFKNVTYTDTSAVAEIIQTVSELKSANFRLGAVNLPANLLSMIQVLKVEKLITPYANESEALEDLTRKS